MSGASQQGERPIISSGTEILGGVFTGRCGMHVDFDENPLPYENAYVMLEDMVTKDVLKSPLLTVKAVSFVVGAVALPYSEDIMGTILKQEARARGVNRVNKTHEIGLSRFAFEGGDCQPQALFGGALLRLLQKRRGIGGQVSIEDRDIIPSVKRNPDRHIWVRYTRGESRAIVDPSSHGAGVELGNLHPWSHLATMYLTKQERAAAIDAKD